TNTDKGVYTMKIIAIEEHFWTDELRDYLYSKQEGGRVWLDADIADRLSDVGEGRIREMDENGIDMQVLCMASGLESIDASEATAMACNINDRLSVVIKEHPERFSGFAALAPQDPDAAASELERAVKELGLKGAKINSHVRGEHLDNEKYWAIFESAEKLGVPIYIHPRRPSTDMLKLYENYPVLTGSIWGFAADTGLHAMKLIFSGVFDKYPGLKIILGHLGEAVPFWLGRIDNRWEKEKGASDINNTKLKKKPGQYFKENFFVTTSGMFWQPPLLCTYMVLGAEKILFAVDYPYESNRDAVELIDAMTICDSDKEKICHLNAERLLSL
ncbi:amidohydrolase family protein, partial [Chloroflexota bacterium]